MATRYSNNFSHFISYVISISNKTRATLKIPVHRTDETWEINLLVFTIALELRNPGDKIVISLP